MRWHVFCDFQFQLVFTAPTGLAHFVSLTIIFPLRFGFLLFAFPVAHIPLFFGRLRMCSQTSFDCLAFMLCFLSLAFICLCPFINGFLSFHLVLVQSWIVLRDFLAPTALAWMAKLLLYSFFSYFIKIFSFSPLYLLRLLALYCGLRVVLSYRSILLHFFCYFGPRSFSHIVHSWGIGSNPVPFVKFDIWWRFEIVALAMWMWTDMEYLVIVAPYGWRGIYILDFLLFFMITHFVYCNWQLHMLRKYVLLAYFATVSCCYLSGQV